MKNGFVRVRYHWSEDPVTDDEWYLKQKKDLNFDKRLINQELDLLFIGSTSCIFDDDFLSELKPKKPIEILHFSHFTKFKLFEELNPNDYYLIGLDSAKSLTGDFCAIELFSYREFKQVGEYFGRLGSLTKLSQVLHDLVKYVDKHSNSRFILGIENNAGFGAAVIEYLEDKDYGAYIYSDKPEQFSSGLNTNSRSKDVMVSLFYDYINKFPENIRSSDLINQLSIIEKRQNGSVGAKQGQHDDLFMSSAFCAYIKKMTLLEIEPLLTYTKEELNKEDNYIISNMAYTNITKEKDSLKSDLFPDLETFKFIHTSEKDLDTKNEDEEDIDFLDFISL